MERGLRRQLNIPILLVIVIGILTDNVIKAQRVNVEPDRALLVEGQKADLLCRYGRPLQYCRISVNGVKILILSEAWNKTPGYTYYGQGLEAGQCGVTIEHVAAENHGNVTCSLGVEGEELSGNIELIVQLPPQRPIIEMNPPLDRNNPLTIDKPINARCIVSDGRPAAQIEWYLDDVQITQGLGQMETIEIVSEKNTTLISASQTLQKYLSPEDNGKSLICRSIHATDKNQHAETNVVLYVQYRPLPQPDVKVYGLLLDRTAFVNVTIQASPKPRVSWKVDGMDIAQGSEQGRYAAYEPIEIGNGLFNATLSIGGLTLEDTTKQYLLQASNGLGIQDYTVRISSSPTPPDTGLDVGSIVGIVVGIAILLIVVLLIIFARATGRWCFAAKSSKSAPNETSDTESADVKPTTTTTTTTTTTAPAPAAEAANTEAKKSKSQRLPSFSSIFKKKNEKTKKDLTTTTEQGSNEGEQQLPTNGEPTNDGNDNNEEPKQLVYAELVLKPSDEKQVAAKASTEYAEIVYVQKPSDADGADEKTK